MIWPSPCLAAVTSGVPSLRRAHTLTSGPSPAERASPEPQWHRQKIIAALLEPGAGETHEDAPLLDPLIHPLFDVVRQGADVCQHERRHVATDEALDAGREVGIVALGDLRERQQCALYVIERRQQRLRLLARGTREKTNAVPLRTGIEQVHRPRRALAGDFNARDLVAQLQGHVEIGNRPRLPGAK